MTSDAAQPLRPSDRQLMAALSRYGHLDRGDLARVSGLPRSTVTDSIARLQQHGLVVERGKSASARTGAGRPATVLALAPPAGLAGTIQLAHESLLAAVIGFDGTLHARQALDHFAWDSADEMAGPALDLLARALAQTMRASGDLACLVVGMPMPVNANGVAVAPPGNLSYPGSSSALPLPVSPMVPADPTGEFERALAVPVWLENDANLAALGEGVFGVATDMSSFLYIKIAQGMGAGLVLDRRLYRGANGLAGELAHIHVEDDGSVCRCGGRGCLMTTFNARRLVERIAVIHPRVDSMTDLLALAARGDAGVLRLLRDLGRTIGRSLADFCVYVAPDGVVIDGVLKNAAQPVVDGVKDALYHFAPPAVAAQVKVVVGTLADNAELRGAAVLARRNLFGHDRLMTRLPKDAQAVHADLDGQPNGLLP